MVFINKTFSVLQWKKNGWEGRLWSSLQINKNYQAWKVCRIDSGKVSINIYTAGQTCTRTDMSPDQSYNFPICPWESFIFIIYAWKSFFISRYVRFTVKMSGIFIRNTEIHASFREKKNKSIIPKAEFGIISKGHIVMKIESWICWCYINVFLLLSKYSTYNSWDQITHSWNWK